MAYNRTYNPDALPAHAEPEQVAQMIGNMQLSQAHGKPLPSRPQPHSAPSSAAPARVPPANAHPQHYHAQAPRPSDPHHQAPHFSGGPTGYNGKPPSAQQRAHPLHPSPPPQNYGFGPRPSQPSRGRPAQSGNAPQVPHPPPLSVTDENPQQLYPLFRAANTSHSGSLTEMELGSALVNGDYTSFHPNTVKMMIRMFDRNRSGTISLDEFVSLWRYLAAWRELFDRFDEDRSGRISLQEFEKALVAFGYRLSQPFVTILFTTFESKGRAVHSGAGPAKDGMSFDLFVQACISLRRMTDVFKQYDDDRDGYITVSFEEFLTEILHLQD